ncbi:MAG: hypothetical protein AAGI23_07930 [Bacteroidota bacterium]
MRNLFIVIIGTIFSVLYSNTILAKGSNPSIFDQLNHKEILNVTIEVDVDELTADWRNDDKYRAVMSFKDNKGNKQFWNIKLQRRGKFRRMHCSGIPPLKIFFDKEILAQKGLAKYDDMKLVNYCYDEDREVAKELIFKEYLAYQLYEQLTEESFRTQLLRVTYKDIRSGKKFRQYAFIIEDAAEMRARIDAKKYKLKEDIAANPFHERQLQLMALFQYMIGNADFDPLVEKNIKVVEKQERVLAIPYDFDFSGFVNPPYGKANTRYKLDNMVDRVYLGSADSLESMIAYFKDKKSDLYTVIEKSDLLNDFSEDHVISYLDSFYDHLTVDAIVAHQATEIYSYGK